MVLDWARRRNLILPISAALIGLLASVLTFVRTPALCAPVALLSAFFVYLEVITELSFRSPPRRKSVIDHSDWEKIYVNINGIRILHYLCRGDTNKPLAYLCHGWTSGAVRMIDRASSFRERGWSVMLVDLPSHGGSDSLKKWSAEETTTLLIGALNRFSQTHRNLLAQGICFFGHSIGAFIGLRISKRRDELLIPHRIFGWIFESPMTGYTEIHRETCNMLRIPHVLRPWVLSKTMRHFNAINGPVRRISALVDADIPTWGMVNEKTLLVQADPDERLGAVHHQRLIECMAKPAYSGLLTPHLLPDLRHSGSHVSDSRKRVVDEWIDDLYDYSSAV